MCSNFKIYRLNSKHPLLYKLRRFAPSNDNFDRLFRFSPDGITYPSQRWLYLHGKPGNAMDAWNCG